uniref:Peroxiredoxin-5, mitochondrial n=1 Tax=Panagrolaimus sp. PS1159 TaxID=55785 RepID=A0AC35F8U2_9BILA
MATPPVPDWSKLPKPIDDGAMKHIEGMQMPCLCLTAVDNNNDNDFGINLSSLRGITVIFAYPRTGKPNVEPKAEWNEIPGARGCTPQNCSYKNLFEEFKKHGVRQLFGLSTQTPEYQRELVKRLELPFPQLCDNNKELTEALTLPTFEFEGETMLKRFAMILYDGLIVKVFYPVFPPDENASVVLEWLKKNKSFC